MEYTGGFMHKTATFLVCISFQFLLAQSVELNLISSAGHGQSSQDLDIQWSVGEAVIGPFDSTANPTTHGFHQLILEEVTGIPNLLREGLPGIRLQKTHDFVKIFFGKSRYTFEVSLFNSKGQRLKSFTTSKGQQILDIPMKYFSTNVVFMNIYTTDERLIKSYKLNRGNH